MPVEGRCKLLFIALYKTPTQGFLAKKALQRQGMAFSFQWAKWNTFAFSVCQRVTVKKENKIGG